MTQPNPDLSLAARGVAAIFAITPILHFKWVESRPTAAMQAALDELVNAGVISMTASVDVDGFNGGVSYRPLHDCSKYLRYAKHANFAITEAIE